MMPARILLAAMVLAASLPTQTALAATAPPPPPADAPRDPPPGTGEAEIRLYCTRIYDEEVALIPDIAGGAGGMLTAPLMEEWTRCLRRNGVEP